MPNLTHGIQIPRSVLFREKTGLGSGNETVLMWHCLSGQVQLLPVFSPEFIDQRAQIVSDDHAPHLECID